MNNLQKTGWRAFIKLCRTMPDEKSLLAWFELMFTAEERQDFALRHLIIKALLQGEKTQREIAQELKVSIAKITRGSNEIKRMQTSLRQYLQKELLQ